MVNKNEHFNILTQWYFQVCEVWLRQKEINDNEGHNNNNGGCEFANCGISGNG